MKLKQANTLFILACLLAFFVSCQDSEKSNLSLLSNQTPTDTALIFAQGVVSTDLLEASITFNPEMSELFFARRKPEESHNIYTSKLVDGKWSKPELVFFSMNKEYLDFHPRINPKGDLLFFGSTRPLNDSTESSGLHQWYIQKNGNGWAPPIPMEKPFVDRYMMCTTPSDNDNLYFTSNEKEANPQDAGIYYAINRGDEYAAIERMDNKINIPGNWTAHPYIAPDESYIIYDSERPSGFGDCDLYISFNENGVWTKSYNLGPKINTELCEGAATVSPDGKYLFFRRDGDIYWIDFLSIKEQIKNGQ